jgi:HK97 family phage prohead protease
VTIRFRLDGLILRSPSAAQWAPNDGTNTTQLPLETPAATITGAGAIATAEALGQPGVAGVAQTSAPASTEAFGAPTVAAAIVPAAIGSSGASGAPAIAAVVQTSALASAEALGQPGVTAGISATAIPSIEALGGPAIAGTVITAGIASGELLGQPDVAGAVVPAGIASREATGAPDIALGIDAASVPSEEALGTPLVGDPPLAQEIVDAGGISSAEAFGAPVVDLVSAAGSAARLRPRRVGQPVEITVHARGIAGVGAIVSAVQRPRRGLQEHRLVRRRDRAGCFSAWLTDVKAGKQEWPAMLSQHGAWGMTSEDLTPVGAWLDLYDDGKGLGVEGELAETQRGGDLYTLMKMKPRPAIKGMSIGYFAREFEMGTKPNEPRRRLKRIDVVEISLVTFPANAKAKVAAVKSIEQLSTVRDAEEYLCAKGLSKTESIALIARIKSASPGDPAGAGGPGDPAAEVAALLKRNTQLLT